MEILVKRRIRNAIAGIATGAVLLTASTAWASGGPEIERQNWTFGGMFGYYDKAQLKRGYMVYKNVCAACHGLKRVAFRNLGEPGGPGYTKEEVEKFAAEAEVQDGPNDEGKMFKRPGKPADRHPSPYANDKEAAAAQNGAVPPDLSLITKARGASRNVAWFMEPAYWAYDMGTMYQEQGSDYVYALMTSYDKLPHSKEECEHKGEPHKWEGDKCTFKLADGMNYNAAFPGYQVAMPMPLVEGAVEYADGTPATVENYARDVSAFLAWTAEPKLEARKSLGVKVLIYLLILSALLYASKRTLWRNVKH